MKTFFYIACVLLISQTGGMSQNPSSSFQWPENYTSAVCLTYDDGLDCHLDVAVPELDSYGVKGTFFCTGYSKSLQKRMNE